MQPIPLVTYNPIHVHAGQCRRIENAICQEIPLEIRVNGTPHVTLMRTPGLERELAIGFCFTDDLIASVDEIAGIECLSASDSPYMTAVNISIPGGAGKKSAQNAPLKSASGAVNKTDILDNILHNVSPISSRKTFDLSVLDELPDKLNAGQTLRSKCGSTHGAAIFDDAGTLLCCTEDIGRHNGLDKLIGSILLNRIETWDKILMLSSRASFEMIQKAVRIAIPVVGSISAPTDFALRVADRLQCAYVSFPKNEGFLIYTHAWRFGLSNYRQIF